MILAGCATYAPPIQEMSDARQSARAAVDAGADRYFPTLMEKVTAQIADAELQLATVDYQGAARRALAAKAEAVRIRVMTVTLTSAVDLVAEAERIAAPATVQSAQTALHQALDAASRGDDATAMTWVAQAQHAADQVLDSHDLERAQALLVDLESDPVRLASVALREAIEKAKVAIQQHEGHRAYSLLAPYATH